jgi:DNA-binding transcriptional LysR family regulator
MDTLTSINVFRQVVESGSFVGAADRLDLSTAMVSKHVMAIEKRLKVRLLNRNSHNLSLTEPGRFYFERCKGILAFRIVGAESLAAGVVARRVRPVAFRLAASRAYLEQHGVPEVPEDLSRHDFVTTGGLEVLSLEGLQGTVEVPLRVALRCRTLADVAITVAGGVGLALLPAALLNDPAFVSVLRPVLTECRLKESTLYLLYADRKHMPFKARTFIDLVLESSAKSQAQKQTGLAASPRPRIPREQFAALAV